MSSHENHHYLPRFLLKQWHSDEFDGNLLCLSIKAGRVVETLHRARGVASERNLYSLRTVDQARRNEIEKVDFQRLDDGAARVHARLLSDTDRAQGIADEVDWTRFLFSLFVRLPHVLRHFRSIGPDYMRDQIEREANPEVRLHARQIFDQRPDDFGSDVATRAVRHLLHESVHHQTIHNAEWAVRRVPLARNPLVMSDIPLCSAGRFDGEFLISLPIAPRVVFIAHRWPSLALSIERMSDQELVFRMNRAIAYQAQEQIYLTSRASVPLARRSLSERLEEARRQVFWQFSIPA